MKRRIAVVAGIIALASVLGLAAYAIREHSRRVAREKAIAALREYKGAQSAFHPEPEPKPAATTQSVVAADVDSAVNQLRSELPEGWEVGAVEKGKVEPIHWPPGSGESIQLRRKGYTPIDVKRGRGGDVRIWIMDEGYDAPGDLGYGIGAQVGAAREVGTWQGRRLLLWGDPGEDWPNWKEAIHNAFGVGEKGQ